MGYAPMVIEQQYQTQSHSYSGQGQSLGRQTFQAHSQSSGMGIASSGSGPVVPPKAHSHHRPVSILPEFQTGQILCSQIPPTGGQL
jgi:hypothetical protein